MCRVGCELARKRRVKTMKRAYLILILVLLNQPIFAQSSLPQQSKPAQTTTAKPTPASSEDDVIKIDLNLVQVDVVVTDKRGRQVTTLNTKDFSLVENGVTRAAEYCVYIPLGNDAATAKNDNATRPPSAAELGRTFVFLVDNPRIEFVTSYSGISSSASATFYLLQRAMRGAIEAEKLLTSFVDSEVGTRDLVAIGDTEVDIGVLSSFTNDRAVLRKAIHHIRNNPTGGSAPVIRVTLGGGGLDLRELANQNLRVLETLSNVIKQLETLPGRKTLTLLSRGMLFNPRWPEADVVIQRMEKVIDQANRAKVSIYTLSPSGVGNFGGDTLQNLDSLIHLAKETGGRAIYNTNDTRVGFAEVVEKSRGYYLLAYKADPETHGRPHSLKVRLNRDDLRVDARSTAYTAAASPNLSTPETLHAAINSPLRETAIPLEITSSFVPSGDGKGEIKLVIRVGVGEADLVNIEEVTKAEFDLAVRITGPDGKLSPASIHQLKLEAKAEARNQAVQEGIVTPLAIPVDTPGFYRISVAVQSKQTKELGSTNSLLEVVLKSGNRLQ